MANKLRRAKYLFAILCLILCIIPSFVSADTNIQMQSRFDFMADSTASATTNHTIGFTLANNTSPLGSIEFQFCSNDPLTGTPCTAPAGFSAAGATLPTETGNAGFLISSLSSANDIILVQSSPITTPSLFPTSYEFSNVVNPSTVGTFYLRIYTYSSIDATGSPTEEGGVALSTTSGLQISSYVPPFLEFCAGIVVYNSDCSSVVSYIVDMGNFSSNQTAVATSQFLVATNASNGYSITVNGTTMTSGNNTINALSTPSPSIFGQNQFGMNLRANNIPSVGSDYSGNSSPIINSDYNTINRYTFNNGDQLVTFGKPSLPVTYTASYITNVDSSQPAGVYTTTLTYICLANF